MAELTIRLSTDPATGKKTIIVRYRSDEDALPLEHEEEHRRLVDLLIQGGVLHAGEAGRVVIEREAGAGVADDERQGDDEQQGERRGQQQGS